jgi:hypothetical protein
MFLTFVARCRHRLELNPAENGDERRALSDLSD